MGKAFHFVSAHQRWKRDRDQIRLRRFLERDQYDWYTKHLDYHDKPVQVFCWVDPRNWRLLKFQDFFGSHCTRFQEYPKALKAYCDR